MRQHHLKRCLPICVTVAIMACVMAKSNWRDVASRLKDIEPLWLVAALALFLPLVLGSSLRWRAMVQPWCRLSVREACAQVLAASALNLALPSKLGDFSKAAFLREQADRTRRAQAERDDKGAAGQCDASPGLVEASAVVVAEKAIDLFALVVLVALGMVLEARLLAAAAILSGLVLGMTVLGGYWIIRHWHGDVGKLRMAARDGHAGADGPEKRWRRLARAAVIPLVRWRLRTLAFVLWSWGLWSIHLTQMAFLFRAAGIAVPFERVMVRMPPAVVAGLVPWTVAGIGTRDSALLFLFSDTAPAAALAVVGMLTALRYLVPGTVGLPILYRRLRSADRRNGPQLHQRIDAPAAPAAEREMRAVPLPETRR